MSITAIITALAPLLAALGIGGIIGQYVATSKDRRGARGARGAAIEALLVLEQARWAGPSEEDEPPFMLAKRKFQSAAIIGDVPREPVRVYLRLAHFSFWHSSEDWEANGDSYDLGMGGFVPVAISRPTQDAARLVAKVIQAGPFKRRWLARRRVWSPCRTLEASMEGKVTEEWRSHWNSTDSMI